ncbi:MAG: hypothetical protein MZV64_29525 [Ignavibacteriales bacterium]|nr:hypothetical protein [Ignavibacteriales bacterium]
MLMAHNVKAVVVACNTVSAVALDVCAETRPRPGDRDDRARAQRRAKASRASFRRGHRYDRDGQSAAPTRMPYASWTPACGWWPAPVRSSSRSPRKDDRSPGHASDRKRIPVPADAREYRHAHPGLHALPGAPPGHRAGGRPRGAA